MNTYGMNIINDLKNKGRGDVLAISGLELKEKIHDFIYAEMKIDFKFKMDFDIQSSEAYLDVDYRNLTEEDIRELELRFGTMSGDEYNTVNFCGSIIKEMFTDNTSVCMSDEAAELLIDSGVIDEDSVGFDDDYGYMICI